MKKIAFLLFCLIFLALNTSVKGQIVSDLDELSRLATLQLTNDQHDSWLDWSSDDRYLAYISVGDSLNLCVLDFQKLQFEKTGPLYFASSFMRSKEVENPITQLTFKKEIVGSPRFHPSNREIYFREYTCDNGCRDFVLKKIDLNTKLEKKVFTGQIDWYFFENDSLIVYGRNDENLVQSLDVNTGETKVLFEETANINGADINEGRIALACDNFISLYTYPEFKIMDKYNIRSTMESLNLIGDNIYTTLRSSQPSIVKINLKKGKYKVISAFDDYQPAISNSQKFLARISDFCYGSIIISKIR